MSSVKLNFAPKISPYLPWFLTVELTKMVVSFPYKQWLS